MEYTVGIVTYKRPDFLKRTLDSLLTQSCYPEEVIIIDDGLKRDTNQVVKEIEPLFQDIGTEFLYFHRESGRKMQSARNKIIDFATRDVICFIDDDVICHSDWLAAIQEGYNNYDIVGVGGPAIKTDESQKPVSKILQDESDVNLLNEYGEVVDASGSWIPPHPIKTDVFRGANMSFKASTLEEINGFDGDYDGPEIFEEWDVMYRIAELGESLLYHPSARVDHLEAQEGGSRTKLQDGFPGTYWYARNSILFRRKNVRDRYWLSLLRLLVLGTDDDLPTVVNRFLSGLFKAELHQFPWLRGYLDGLRKYRGPK